MGSGDKAELAKETKFSAAESRIRGRLSDLDAAIDEVNGTLAPTLSPEEAKPAEVPENKAAGETDFDMFINETDAHIQKVIERLNGICTRSAV